MRNPQFYVSGKRPMLLCQWEGDQGSFVPGGKELSIRIQTRASSEGAINARGQFVGVKSICIGSHIYDRCESANLWSWDSKLVLGCWQYSFDMKLLIYGILFLHLSSLDFCPRTSFLKNWFYHLPWNFPVLDLQTILRIISRSVSGLATNSTWCVWGRRWTTCPCVVVHF